eukprot:TRINITY_DN21938_c0_g1_i1.p1 TRINITY_DN21938_c0_g1~~TRINITY_DN21938_c0_g1_i1.p1  ORF type:complete len:135 (-),score=35.05 TRINITY_DN21938_c0_g1_i1:282-686(-)
MGNVEDKEDVIEVEDEQVKNNHKLIESCKEGDTGFASVLIASGAKVNCRDQDGWTPLHWAAGNGYEDLAAMLVEKGAKIRRKSRDGFTPKQVAEIYDHKPVIGILATYERLIEAKEIEFAQTASPIKTRGTLNG